MCVCVIYNGDARTLAIGAISDADGVSKMSRNGSRDVEGPQLPSSESNSCETNSTNSLKAQKDCYLSLFYFK